MVELSFIGNKKGLMNYIGSEICEMCLGTGECSVPEMDSDGYWSDTGTRKCECKLVEEEYDNQE